MKRLFVKYYGFGETERHALHTVFRLSESHETIYSPWTPESAQAPEVLLVDGDSWEAVLALANPEHDGIKLVWVGEAAPPTAWRVFPAPVRWSAVIEALDAEFAPLAAVALSLDRDQPHAEELDVHVDAGDDTQPMQLEDTATPAARRVLVVDAMRDARLYLRAKLATAGLYEVDEAATVADALALLRTHAYHLVTVDLDLPDRDSRELLKAVDSTRPAIAYLFVTGTEPAWRRGLQAWMSGAQVYLQKPLEPERLAALLQNI